jgi:hypothetical protein
VKFGISVSAAYMVVLLPLIAAFIIYEVATFPAHLGEKVSAKVVVELGGKFDKINEKVMVQIIRQFSSVALVELGKSIAEDVVVQQSIVDLIDELA